MSTVLSGISPADQLVEALAGSTALLSDPANAASPLPLSLSGLTGDASTDGGGATAMASGSADTSAAGLLDPVTSLLGGITGSGTGDLPLVGDLTGASSSGLPILGDLLGTGTSTDGSALQLAGTDGTLQPVLNGANTVILDLHNNLELLGQITGTEQAIHGVTTTGETIGLGNIGTTENSDGHTNLVTDVLNAPGSILDGNLGATISHLGTDLSDIANALLNTTTPGLVGSVLFGSEDATNPIPELLSNLGNDLQHLPLLSVNGGNNGNDGGLLGGIIGSLNNPSSGHLVDLDVGPQQDNGLALNLLSQPTPGPHNALDVSAVDVGPGGPHLADLGLLTGGTDGLHLPSLGGIGTDSLAGSLPLGNLIGGGIASGNSTSVPVSAPLDLGATIHDLISAPVANNDHGILNLHGTHII